MKKNGERYDGYFENWLRHGPKGSYYYENGDRYIGDWSNNERNGLGQYEYMRIILVPKQQ